ncbi:MAG: hypothetical protein RLZZ450_1031 [Pseudomonadota bacterium]|jgi:hypothetical protein
MLASATVLAMAAALWTRRLVEAAALDAVRVERARGQLEDVVRAHHDARTRCSSLVLQLDAVLDGFERTDASEHHDAAGSVAWLRAEMRALGAYVQGIAEQTFERATFRRL